MCFENFSLECAHSLHAAIQSAEQHQRFALRISWHCLPSASCQTYSQWTLSDRRSPRCYLRFSLLCVSLLFAPIRCIYESNTCGSFMKSVRSCVWYLPWMKSPCTTYYMLAAHVAHAVRSVKPILTVAMLPFGVLFARAVVRVISSG